MLSKEEKILRILGEIECLNTLSAEIKAKKRKLEKTLVELQSSKPTKRSNKVIAVDFLKNRDITIHQGNKNNWYHLKPKGYDLSRGREYTRFRTAVCVWLASYLTDELIAKELGVERSAVSYMYRVFVDEMNTYAYPHKESIIQSLVLSFDNYGR